MEISWTDRVTNDKVLLRSKGKRNIQSTIEIERGRLRGLTKSSVGTAFWNTLLRAR